MKLWKKIFRKEKSYVEKEVWKETNQSTSDIDTYENRTSSQSEERKAIDSVGKTFDDSRHESNAPMDTSKIYEGNREEGMKIAEDKKRKKGKIKDFKVPVQKKNKKIDKELKSNILTKLNRIRVKLVLAFLIPVVFIILLGVSSYNNASNALVKSYKESTFNSVVTTRNYFELATSAIELRLTQLKGYDSLKNYYAGAYKDDPVGEMLTYKELKTYVETTAFLDDLIANIGLFCKYGESIGTTGTFSSTGKELVDKYLQTEEGALDQEERGGYRWAGRHNFFDENLVNDSSKPMKKYAFSISSAFFGNGLKQIGYMIGDISYDLVLEQLKALEVGENSIFAAISADGYEVSNMESMETLISNQEFYQNVVQGTETEGSSYVTYKGEDYLFSYAKVGKTGIIVCGLVPNSYLTSQATSILISTLLFVIIAVILATGIGTFIATGMGRTIKRMIKAMKQAAQGDLTVSVECRRKDEFRVLSDSANHMIGNMKNLIEKANQVKDTMNISTKEVADSTESLTVATKNISNSIEEIRLGIVQQAEDSEKCLVQSEELGSRVQTMLESIGSIEQLTKQSHGVVSEGVISVDTLKLKADETAKITKTIILDMNSLEEESKSIGKIINVINDIAEQTNLLSLNASIEAARAGDAGRGFAVVADEIRKLAEQSMKASKEIGLIVSSIQAMTNHTVETVKVSDDIVKSQSIALNDAVKIFQKITTSVEDISEKLKDITLGIDSIKDAKATTIGAIESISAVSEETAAASEEVDNAANRQVITVEKLKQATIHLTEEAEELNKALNIFKI